MKIAKGAIVKVEYTGTLDDGTVFDSSEKHGAPLEFEVGAGQLIKGFEEAVTTMEIGEEKDITLKPSEAYGDPNPMLVKQFSRDQLPKDQELKPGMILVATLPNGAEMPAIISEVTDETVTINLNHPLAGKTLHFKIKLLEAKES